MWQCKECKFSAQDRQKLSSHYRLKHVHNASNPQPCLYQECPCKFKTSTSLYAHLSRAHPSNRSNPSYVGDLVSFRCVLCRQCDHHTEKTYFEHLYQHLKKFETISCIYEGCSFTTNVYGTFKSHKSRKHASCTLQDFQNDVIIKTTLSAGNSQTSKHGDS